MKISTKLFSSLVFLSLAACSNGSSDHKNTSIAPGIDASGNCTQETVDAYNQIGISSFALSVMSTETATTIKNSCDKLTSLIGGNSCMAENLMSGDKMPLSYSGVQDKCSLAAQSLNPAPVSPAPSVESSPAPTPHVGGNLPPPRSGGARVVDDSRRVLEFQNGFLLVIKNAQMLNRVGSNDNAINYLQSGNIETDINSIDSQKDFCIVLRSSIYQIKNADVLKINSVDVSEGVLSLNTSRYEIMLSCRVNEKEAVTMGDLREILGDTFEIRTPQY